MDCMASVWRREFRECSWEMGPSWWRRGKVISLISGSCECHAEVMQDVIAGCGVVVMVVV